MAVTWDFSMARSPRHRFFGHLLRKLASLDFLRSNFSRSAPPCTVYLTKHQLSPHPLCVESPGAVGFLLYFLVGQASLLSRVVGGGNVHKAVDGAGNNVVWNTYRAVHFTIGLVIMVPILVIAFFPFMTHFQVRRCIATLRIHA